MFGLAGFGQTVFDGIAIFPVYNYVSTDESATFTETDAANADFVGLDANTVTLSDIGPGSFNFFGSISESSVFDTLQSSTVDLLATTTEAATFTEDFDGALAFAKDVSESLTLTTVEIGNVNFNNPSITETTTLTDTEDGYRGQFDSVTETTTLTNTQASQVVFAPSVTETTTFTDVESTQVAFVATEQEQMTLTAEAFARGWVTIVNTDSITWTQINDSQ